MNKHEYEIIDHDFNYDSFTGEQRPYIVYQCKICLLRKDVEDIKNQNKIIYYSLPQNDVYLLINKELTCNEILIQNIIE